MLLSSAVAVWEWMSEQQCWQPYSPAVSRHIEAVIRSDSRAGSIMLGQVDSRLASYIIDLQSMHQFRQDTGTLHPVRRSFYDPTCAPAQGWVWEWESDAGSWTPYGMEVGIAIQAQWEQQQPWLDLEPLGLCHLVDFQTMTQINKQTQERQRIRRRADLAYPAVSGPLPKAWQAQPRGTGALAGGLLGVGASGVYRSGTATHPRASVPRSTLAFLSQACSCPQCMLVLSIKSGSMARTLGQQLSQKPNSSRTSQHGAPVLIKHWAHTVPRTLPQSKSPAAASEATNLGSPASTHPPLSKLPPPAPPPVILRSSLTPDVPTATLITTVPPTAATMATKSSLSAAIHAPVPTRASLAGLSQPALRRIAVAQSQALIASGIPTVPVKSLGVSSSVYPALAGITGILMSAAGLPVCLTHPAKPVLHPPPVNKRDIMYVPGLDHCCRKITKKQTCRGKRPQEVVKKFTCKVRNPPEEDCTICMEPLRGPLEHGAGRVGGVSCRQPVGRFVQCSHQYHLQCLVAMYTSGNRDGTLQCPTCKTVYGEKTGSQPPGKMEYHVIPHSLPGHSDCRTIRIIYTIPPGIQGPDHPNPGKPYTARGFPRQCYLPDNEKGRKILRLLLVAWDRRIVFGVGTSSTTGESDTVIWNGVHHKTEFGSNLTGHGYPDPGHLDNVLEELRAQGITEEDSLLHRQRRS